ncbi:hypothetical protein TNCV_2131191 [Trichonephila clavipes]|nr:hypothetical protein TNCV_2131191 [Trichonephila clavipes]
MFSRWRGVEVRRNVPDQVSSPSFDMIQNDEVRRLKSPDHGLLTPELVYLSPKFPITPTVGRLSPYTACLQWYYALIHDMPAKSPLP